MALKEIPNETELERDRKARFALGQLEYELIRWGLAPNVIQGLIHDIQDYADLILEAYIPGGGKIPR